MSEENKTILLKVTLDTADLKKSSEEASARLLDLRQKQTLVDKSTKEGTAEYAKLSAEIRIQNKILNDSSKALVINDKLNNKNTGSLAEMRQALQAGSIAYSNLSKEQQQNEDIGGKLQKQNFELKTSINQLEQAQGNYTGQVGNYNVSLQDLKKELKSLKSEMVGLDAGSKEYQEASEKAGQLGDKIKEVNENVKASSGGTGFEKLSNNLGLVKDDLMNLDFTGVSEKMKQMATISKGMTFKEVVGGLKNMGSALLSLGKAILANPMFLMVGAIVAIVGALKMWSDKGIENAIQAQKKHTKSIEDNINQIKKQRDINNEINDLYLRRAELEGKSIQELGMLKRKALKEQNVSELQEIKNTNKLIESLIKEKGKTRNEEETKEVQERINTAKEGLEKLYVSTSLYETKRTNLILETENEIAEKKKEKQATELEKQKEHQAKVLELQKTLSDLLLDNEDSSNDLIRQKLEAKFKFELDNAEGNTDEIIEIQKRKISALNSLDEEQKSDDLKRAKYNYEVSIKDLKEGSELQLAEHRKYVLEKKAIENNFENVVKSREAELTKTIKENNIEKVLSAKKTDQEIRLIDAETKHLQATTEADKLATFKELQATRIAIIQENANLEIQAGKKVGKEKELIEKKSGEETLKISQETYTKKSENELTEHQKKVQKEITVTLNSAVQLTDALSQITQNRIQNEINEEQNKNDEKQTLLQSQLDAGLISEAQFKASKESLDKEFKAKESKLKKEAFEKEKQANIIKAIMNTAVGVTAASPVVPLMILAGVMGAIQVGLIASQPTPKFAKGGVFGGKSHDNGGTKGVFDDGTQIEVEKDESFFILNKRATPLISQLSNINQSTGGVPLMAKGGVMKFANGGAVMNTITGQIDNQFTQQNAFMKAVRNMPNPVVSVREIITAQNNVAVVENRAIF